MPVRVKKTRQNQETLVVAAMFDDHDLIAMMPPTLVPAAITMLAVFGPRAHPVMVAMLDHDGLGAGN